MSCGGQAHYCQKVEDMKWLPRGQCTKELCISYCAFYLCKSDLIEEVSYDKRQLENGKNLSMEIVILCIALIK